MASNRIVSIILRGDVAGFKASMTSASASAADVGKRMTASNKEAAEFRQGLTAVGSAAGKAGLVATAGVALITKAAMDWESAWAGVTKTVDGTPAQLSAIEQGLQKMSAVKPTTAIELAAIAESAGALGVKREDLLGFTSVMADLGETTNLTSEDAATSIAQLMNVMQTAPEDVDNLGAALVDLGNKGASTERQIIEMAQNIAGAGAIVGLSEANVLALGNALASSGIDAEAGGSAISNVMIDIDKAVSTGSDKLGEFAKVAGMSAEDFAAKWESTPADAIATFVEGLGRMNASGEDVFSTLTSLGQSDIRVTRALLNMAASGDMLRESLANGDAAWKSNTALADESAKRYDTTAAQAKMAWNEITTAAVGAGQAMLPVVASVAGALGDLAGAFSTLPSGVKGGLAVFTAIAGAGLLAVSGVSKVVNTVTGAREALDKLSISSPKAAGALGRIGKAAGLASVALGGVAIAGQLLDSADKWDIAGVNEFTKALLDAADGSDKLLGKLSSTDASGPFGWNRNGIDGIADAFDNAAEAAGKMDLSFGHDSSWERGSKLVDQVDSSLSALISSGAGDRAAEIFDYLGEATGRSEKALLSMLPQYKEGLLAVDVQSDLAADGMDKFGLSATGAGGAASESAEEIKAAQEALDAAREAALATSLSFFDFSRDAEQSFDDYLDKLEKSADAFANFTENAIKASANGLDGGLIDKLKEEGPEGALALADFADASEKEIKRANDAFRDTTGLSELQAELDLLPDDVVTQFKTAGAKDAIKTAVAVATEYEMSPELVETILKAKDYTKADIKAVLARLAELDATTATPDVRVDVTDAFGKVRSLQQYINGMNGKTIKIAVERGTPGGITRYMGGTVPEGYASGGKVPGIPPSDPTRDNVLAMGATTGSFLKVRSGEWIINQQQSEKNDKWLAAINAGLNIDDIITGYASGGRVSRLDILRQQQTVRDLERSLVEREEYGKKRKGKKRPTRLVLKKGSLDRRVALEELAAAKKELRDLKSGKAAKVEAREELASQRADRESNRLSAKSDFSSNFDIGSSMSTAAVDRKLERMIADSTTFVALLSDLKRKGASPWLLAQLVEAGPTPGAIRLARQYSTDSAALARVNAQARQIDSISNSYSQLVTNPAFSAPRAWNSGISPTVSAAPVTASLVGAEIAVGADGLMRFVKGQIVMSQDSQQIDFRMATT